MRTIKRETDLFAALAVLPLLVTEAAHGAAKTLSFGAGIVSERSAGGSGPDVEVSDTSLNQCKSRDSQEAGG